MAWKEIAKPQKYTHPRRPRGQLVSQTKGVSWAKDVVYNSFAHENAITRLAACESPRIAIKHLI